MKLWYQENIEGWTEEELTAILETFLKSLEPEQEGN